MILTRENSCLNDQQLARYLEGKISAAEREDFEKHLSACNFCLKVVAESKKSLLQAPQEAVPEGLTERIISRISASLTKEQIPGLWSKVKEGVWQLTERIEIIFDAAENAFSLVLPGNLTQVNLAPVSVRGPKKNILESFEIPLPQDKIRLGVTLYMVASDEIELSIQAVSGTNLPENLVISLCEENGRILKSETLKPDSNVCFSPRSLSYFISIEYKERVFRIPLRQK